jgi:hypothetical protein
VEGRTGTVASTQWRNARACDIQGLRDIGLRNSGCTRIRPSECWEWVRYKVKKGEKEPELMERECAESGPGTCLSHDFAKADYARGLGRAQGGPVTSTHAIQVQPREALNSRDRPIVGSTNRPIDRAGHN